MPPEQYLAECVAAKPHGLTNAALAEYTMNLKQALELCNEDKRALREWSTSIK